MGNGEKNVEHIARSEPEDWMHEFSLCNFCCANSLWRSTYAIQWIVVYFATRFQWHSRHCSSIFLLGVWILYRSAQGRKRRVCQRSKKAVKKPCTSILFLEHILLAIRSHNHSCSEHSSSYRIIKKYAFFWHARPYRSMERNMHGTIVVCSHTFHSRNHISNHCAT